MKTIVTFQIEFTKRGAETESPEINFPKTKSHNEVENSSCMRHVRRIS